MSECMQNISSSSMNQRRLHFPRHKANHHVNHVLLIHAEMTISDNILGWIRHLASPEHSKSLSESCPRIGDAHPVVLVIPGYAPWKQISNLSTLASRQHGNTLRIENTGSTSWKLLCSSSGLARDDDDERWQHQPCIDSWLMQLTVPTSVHYIAIHSTNLTYSASLSHPTAQEAHMSNYQIHPLTKHGHSVCLQCQWVMTNRFVNQHLNRRNTHVRGAAE